MPRASVKLGHMQPPGPPRWNLRPLPYNGLPWEAEPSLGPPGHFLGILRGAVGQPDLIGLRVDPKVGANWGLYLRGPIAEVNPRVELLTDPTPLVAVHLDAGPCPLTACPRTFLVTWEWLPERADKWEVESAVIIHQSEKGGKERNPLPCYKRVARKRR